jgi:Predicted integral membrane protein (DUF2269)
MRGALRLLHRVGFVAFLGSIATFAVASAVPAAGDLRGLAVVRRVISAGTSFLTLPGLGVLVLSGMALAWGRAGLARQRWLRIMALAGLVILANALLFVVPAERSATCLAEEGVAADGLPAGYARAYAVESAAGGLNVIVALLAMASGVLRPAGAATR